MNNKPSKTKPATSSKTEDTQIEVDQLKHQKHLSATRYIFATIVVVLFFGFIITAICIGKDELVSEMIKATLYTCGGAFGGYGISMAKKVLPK